MKRRQLGLGIPFVFLLVVLALTTSVGQAQSVPPVKINEVLVGNASTNLDLDFTNYSSWVELHNIGNSAVNLAGYKLRSLRKGASQPESYMLPSGTSIAANGYLLVWVDEENTGLHTQFQLDMDGGDLTLMMPDDTIVDDINYEDQEPDVSLGRSPNGTGGFAYFDQPTPRAANATPAYGSHVFALEPAFSLPGGFHTGVRSVTLNTTEPDATIRYTLDGSKPTASSTVYSGPININSPTVVRARTFVAGKMASRTATHTYLINVPANMAVVSIATDPAHLFDNTIGIYVVGAGANKPHFKMPWERPASIEMYETDGSLAFSQDAGFEISGGSSRAMAQKSLELKARKRYGDNDFNYAVFADRPLTAYSRLILRHPGNQGADRAIIREPLAHMLAKDGRMDLDYMDYRPVVVFLNGQYWGIYGLRQKPDENFVETMYGLDEEDIDMIDRLNTVIVGNTVKWNAFYTFFQTNNLATPANYAYMKSQMDVDEFINYQILEIYSANTDWTHRNYRFWSARVPGYPWRWVLQDMDAAFGARSGNVFNHKTLQYATSKSGLGATQTLLTRKLLENPEFKAEFVQRFAVYLNTTFAPANVIFLLDGMANEIAPEVPAHVARWRIPASMTAWNASLAKVRTFATRRPDLMRGQINSLLTKQGLGTLTVTSVGGGEVWVAGAPVPANYSGPHFLGFDMTLEAAEPPGVDFVEWENGSTSRTRTIPFNGNTVVTAYFGEEPPPPPPPNLVINEIHYLPSPATDELDREYVEIISAETETVDLSGFTIPAISFTFPAGASIDPGEYIVVAANSGDPFFSDVAAGSLFDFNWVSGSDPNRLGNGGEVLAVLDTLGQVADTVTYDDGGLWTSAPDGNGPSLALLEPGLDNSLAASWAASREAGGTPGAENFPPLPPTPPLVINEIHYNPSDAHGADADYEFIEILNTGVDAVVLDGFTLVGVEYTFAAGTTIGAGEFIVLAANATNYVGSYTVYQWASGELADDGERIAILDSYNQVSDEVTYDEVGPWPTTPNGTGPSLALLGPMLDNSDAASWQASTADNGTPGGVNFLP